MQGDASITAYYRLGVGVNHAFRAGRDIGQLVVQLQHAAAAPNGQASIAGVVRDGNSRALRRLSRLAQVWTWALFNWPRHPLLIDSCGWLGLVLLRHSYTSCGMKVFVAPRCTRDR